jgi:hypothetical protein
VPGNAHSLAITAAYRTQLVTLRDRFARAVAVGIPHFAPDNFDRSWGAWVGPASALVTTGQRTAATMSDAYLTRFTGSELGQAIQPQGLNPDDYAGHTPTGTPLLASMRGPLIHAKLAIGQGATVAAALAIGASWAFRDARADIMGAGRTALTDAMRAEDRIIGWERITSDSPCGACLDLADQGLRRTDEDLEIHASCACTAEPVLAGVDQTESRPTGMDYFNSLDEEQQNALFAGRGGDDMASGLRDGSINLDDLVTRHEVGGQTYISETPLSALTSSE